MYQRAAELVALILLVVLLLPGAWRLIRKNGLNIFPGDGAAGRCLANPQRLLVQHRLLPGTSVLLVGPDLGSFPLEAARLIAPGWLTCLDAEPGRLKTIREKAREYGIDNIVTLAGEAVHLPFAPGRFDQVVLVNSLGRTGDQEAALVEIARVLKDSGRLTISDSFLAPGYHSARHVVRLAAPAGFAVSRRTNDLFFYTLEMIKPLKGADPARLRPEGIAWPEQLRS